MTRSTQFLCTVNGPFLYNFRILDVDQFWFSFSLKFDIQRSEVKWEEFVTNCLIVCLLLENDNNNNNNTNKFSNYTSENMISEQQACRTALLLMDFQPGWNTKMLWICGTARLNSTFYLNRLDILQALFEDKQKSLLKNAKMALKAARKKKIHVIFVRVAFRPGYPEVPANHKIFSGIMKQGVLLEGTPNSEIHPLLKPLDSKYHKSCSQCEVLQYLIDSSFEWFFILFVSGMCSNETKSWGLFYNRSFDCEQLKQNSKWNSMSKDFVFHIDLESILRAKGITHLVMAGISTSGVVLSTLRWAADFDYEITGSLL